MAIHFISGKPGSGKSLYGVHLLIKEITQGNRNVVTNLPLHPGRLNEYLQQQYPNKDCRLLQRLTVMTEDQARKFWEYRGDEQPYGTELLTAEKTRPGVIYLLDELHLFFNSRDWMHTGRACLHYLSQHRKLGDVVVAITQSVPNVDKQFRSVAEDFTLLRNEYTAQYGPFRGRGRFVRKTYLSEPTGSTHQEPFETASFTLDAKGIASCYDTAQGIGIHGSTADKGRRASGWSIWWTIPLGIGVASLAGIVPWLMAKGAARIVEPPTAVSSAIHKNERALDTAAKTNRIPEPSKLPSFAVSSDTIWVSGYIARGPKINVLLSNGRTLTERGESIAIVERNFIELTNGERLWLKSGAGAAPARPEAVARGGRLLPPALESVPTVGAEPSPSGNAARQQPALD